MVAKQKNSLVVNFQAPEFIRSDYAKFITFLKSYYEYLEQTDKTLDVMRNLDTYNDIDEQTNSLILSVFYTAFLPDFPQILSADRKFLLKNIVDFYNSKGSNESIKAFFRIVYGEEIQIYLPKIDIIKVGAGIWKKRFKIKLTGISSGTIYELLGQEIYQISSITGNKTVRARIVDYEELTGSVIITADNIVLNFDSSIPVYTTRNDTGATVTFTLINQLASATVSYGGLNYSSGDNVEISTAVSNTENIQVDNVSYGVVRDIILNTNGDNYSTLDEISFDDNYLFNPSVNVSTADNTITISSGVSLTTGDIVTYRVTVDNNNNGTAVGGLVDDTKYYIITVSNTIVKLATTKENAINGISIDLTTVGSGTKHYLVYELPGVVKAKAKITKTSSDDLYGDVADLEGEYPTIVDDEDKLLFEDGQTIKEELGETNTFKSITKNKYNTDDDRTGISTGSITSDDFGIMPENQENDSVVYTRSSYNASNGLIRQFLPAVSDPNKQFSLEWAQNKGITAVLQDEELRVGFAYEDSYAASGSYTPSDPMTIVIEFQSNEDYNNLERYELVRTWGTTSYPEIKNITSWDYSTPTQYEDFNQFSELQHIGIYPESAAVVSYGEKTVSQKGFDPNNKPIIYIRERVSDVDSSFTTTQRPWEYKFVFKENTKSNIKIYVNSQPIKTENQLIKTEDSAFTLFNEDNTYLFKEIYTDVDTKAIDPSIAGSNDTFTSNDHGFVQGDKVKFTTDDSTSHHSSVVPPMESLLKQTTIGVAYTGKFSDTIIAKSTGADSAVITIVDDDTSYYLNSNYGVTPTITTTGTLPVSAPWAGIATNGSGQLLLVKKSNSSIEGVSASYSTDPTNVYYTATLSSTTSAPAWTEATLPITGVWGNVEYGNGNYVVVQGTGNPRKEPTYKFVPGTRAVYSSDATNWTQVTLPISDYWTDLKFVNGRFFLLPYGNIRNELNGSVYESVVAGETLELRAPVGAVFTRVLFSSYGDPTGANGNYYVGTVDSPLSISQVEKQFLGKNYSSIVASDTIFGTTNVAGKRLYVKLEYAYQNQTLGLMSFNGSIWDQITFPFSKCADLAYGNGVYVLTSYNNTSDYAYSYDLIKWKTARFPISDKELNNYENLDKSFWSSVVFGYDKFIATFNSDPNKVVNSQIKNKFAVSSDGINWDTHTNASYASTITSTGSASTGKGYFLGGLTRIQSPLNNTSYTEIDGINFTTEAAINPAAALVQQRFGAFSTQSTTKGYVAGGVYNPVPSSPVGVWINSFENITFSTESGSAMGITLAAGRYQGASTQNTTRAYFLGGNASGSVTSEVDGLVFSSETYDNPASTLTNITLSNSGLSSATKGYTLGGYSPSTIIESIVFSSASTSVLGTALPTARSSAGSVQNLTTKGYVGGSTSPFTTSIVGFVFSSESVTSQSAVLQIARQEASGVSSSTRGYFGGGVSYVTSPTVFTNYDEIDGIRFDTESSVNPSAVLTSSRSFASGVSSPSTDISISTNYVPEIEQSIYDPTGKVFAFVAQNKKRTDVTTTTTFTNYGNGYFGGGLTPSTSSEIDGINFQTEASVNPAATLATARYIPTGMMSSTIGYFFSGWSSTAVYEIDGIRFSNQTAVNPSASSTAPVGGHSSTTGSMSNDGQRGYMHSGHISPLNTNMIQRFDFPTETAFQLVATAALPRYMGAGGYSAVTNKGYYMGGYSYTAHGVPADGPTTEIDGLDMTSETAINPSAVLSVPVSHNTSLNFTNYAVVVSGYGTGGTTINEVETFTFDTESVTNVAWTMPAARFGITGVQNINLNKGFIAGAQSPAVLSSMLNFNNTTFVFANIAATLAAARGYMGGVSEPTSTTSYSNTSLFNSDNSSIGLFTMKDQLTKNKSYLVNYVSSSQFKLAKSRKDLIDGVYVTTSPQTTDNTGYAKLITDRIDAGSQDSFTKASKNAQFNVYAKKQTAGFRSSTMKINQNPNVATYDDTEKSFKNYTSDNKYYIYEAVNESTEYLVMERSDIEGTDQVNIELELDKRSETEKLHYVTYPYLASETSIVSKVQANNEIDIPNYSKVRLFVDSSVLQSVNSVERNPEELIYNDYGSFDLSEDATVLNKERDEYFNLSNPIVSETSTTKTYRNNYNVVPFGHEDKPYVVGLTPATNQFSSGPGEFGNTGITSFVQNTNIRFNADAAFLDNTFYTIAASTEQAYYDNDPNKPTKDGRTFHTFSFNVPKEVGATFDNPLTVAIKNLVTNRQNNTSHKTVDYGDKILLGETEKLSTIVQLQKRPIEWTPVLTGNVNWITTNQKNLRISTTGFSGQSTFYPYYEPIIKEVKNNDLIRTVSSSTILRYNNLPSYLAGLQATNSINDSDTAAFYTNNRVRVFLLRNPSWNAVDTTTWLALTFETNKNYIVDNATGTSQAISVFYKDFEPGGPYTLDNNSAIYLFQNLAGPSADNSKYGFYKPGTGDNVWDAQVFSREGFIRNVFASARINRVTANSEWMFGLNSDPSNNASFDTIDYCWYPNSSGAASIYESGSSIGTFGTYTAGSTFEITYDGTNVIYYLDGNEKRRVTRSIGNPLFLDSSLYKQYGTNTTAVSMFDVDFGELNVPVSFDLPKVPTDTSVPDEISLEDNSATIAAETNIFGLHDVGGNYSNVTPSLAIEFYSPSLALDVAKNGLSNSNSSYHMVYYCDKAEYLNVSTDTQKTTYKFYNCWSPTNSNTLNVASTVNDYIVTIRDLTKNDYIIKKKNDFINKITTNGLLYRDVWVSKSSDDYGKYVKFYPSYADSVADTNIISLSTLNIGTAKTFNQTSYSGNSIVAEDPSVSKIGHSYYGAIEENDILRTFRFDPNVDVSANAITISNHGLRNGDRVLYRVDFNGAKITGLTDNTIYSVIQRTDNTLKLSSDETTAITLTASVETGKRNYLQIYPESLDFGSTKTLFNTKTEYSVSSSDLVPYSIATGLISNLGEKQYVVEGRNDILQVQDTTFAFKNPVEFNTGDYIRIELGGGDQLKDHDGTILTGTQYAYAIRYNDRLFAFVKRYEEALDGITFLTGYYNNSQSVFSNTIFYKNESKYNSGSWFNAGQNALPPYIKDNMKVKFYGTSSGKTPGASYYVDASSNSFTLHNTVALSGVQTFTNTDYNNLVEFSPVRPTYLKIVSPMITGTVKEDVTISYSPYPSRETGIIENFELTNKGNYNRIPNATIITDDGRLGTGAEIYPIVDDIGVVNSVTFIDGGTHSVNRTLYLPYSFFSETITGTWEIGEKVSKSGTEIGTLVEKNGRYFKIEQNGSATTVTYADTLIGMISGATAVVGRTLNISAATNARPAKITTTTPHYLNTGDFVYVSGINSTVANGIYYVTVTGVNTFALFTNVTMATPYDSRLTSAYVSGGTVSAGLYTAQGTAIPGEITLSSANGPTNNYENDKNLILPTSKVQDSYYYQDYSYVVRSGVSFENWKPYFNKLVHPAGIAVFGEVDYANVNSGQVLMGNTEVVNNQINNTKTTTSTTVTIT